MAAPATATLGFVGDSGPQATRPSNADHAAGVSVPGPTTSVTDRPLPYLLLAGAAALLVPIRAATGPIRDIDVYWHLLVGREILSGIPVSAAGRGWSFAPVPDTWVSTQWLAEALLARIELWGGLDALIVYRVVTASVALGVLAAVTLVHRPVRAGAWVFAFAAAQLSIVVQERSQMLTFILAPLVGRWCDRVLREGRLPRWWVVLPLVIVWSNFHGGWVLLPLFLGVTAVARLIDRGWRDPVPYRALALSGLSVAAACVSPSGVGNAVAAARFSQATAIVGEWQPVRLWDGQALPFAVVILIVVLAWTFGRVRPTRGEAVLAVSLMVFGVMAWRNVTPATLILAPIATGILARALGETDPRPAGARPALRRTAVALALAGAVAGLVLAGRQSPIVPDDGALRLLATIKAVPTQQRVLDSYNLSGALLWFGGPPPHVVVGIDGRADRYGSDYALAYQDGLIGARPGWEKLFDQLRPTCALLYDTEALSSVLVTERHWVEVGRAGHVVLLRAPDATGWPAHP